MRRAAASRSGARTCRSTPPASTTTSCPRCSRCSPMRMPSTAHRRLLVWFYTPMALPLADRAAAARRRLRLHGRAVRVQATRRASCASARTRCSRRADLVFTGGRSLYERQAQPRTRTCICFPSSVDAQHFAQARDAQDHRRCRRHIAAAAPGLLRRDRRAHRPRADRRHRRRRPDWQIVMVGPVVKIDPAALPQRPNIHWLGQQALRRAAAPSSQAGTCACCRSR